MNKKERGSDIFIVDNSDKDWKVKEYLHQWCEIASSIDIATGFFEIGALITLDKQWQKLSKIKILMGNEVSWRTKQAFLTALSKITDILDDSIESEKEINDFLVGVSAIVEALVSKKIECRAYRKKKFHAKSYITHGKLDVVGSVALVGSSNFTVPGLSQNVELNIQIRREVDELQEWYEKHWKEAEDVTPDILKTIERHTRDYTPFELYVKSLAEFFKRHEQTVSEWEENGSVMYKKLDTYQKDGYHDLLKRASTFNGAFLCDGVGLGKTFIGLMLIERFVIREHKHVALFVPKGAYDSVWKPHLEKYLPEIFEGFYGFKIFKHTDLLREKLNRQMDQVRIQADIIIIDEAHNFRNTGTKGDSNNPASRYWHLYDIAAGKQMFMLTATPVNNSLTDFQHMVELFSRDDTDYFKYTLGIHSLRGHIKKMEKDLEELLKSRILSEEDSFEVNYVEAEDVLEKDKLFDALVVQRSRAYVKRSYLSEDKDELLFPKPTDPKVAPYSVKQTYCKLLNKLELAFNKKEPLFSLPIYYPWAYYKGQEDEVDSFAKGRQMQVVRLIRTNFLKRFESSVTSFRSSCWNLLLKIIAWIDVHAETMHETKMIARWKTRNKDLISFTQNDQLELFGDVPDDDVEEDIITSELLESVVKISREDFKISEIIGEAIEDLNQIADFLKELEKFKPSQDKKLRALIKLLKNDQVLSKHKVLIFTEFKDTAKYLKKQLIIEGIEGVDEIDSSTKENRADIIQ